MNEEDIYNGITDIRDDQITEAQAVETNESIRHGSSRHGSSKHESPSADSPERKKRRKRWLPPLAAALVLALIAGIIWNPWNDPLRAYAVSTAEYPRQAQYSVLNDDPWREGRRARFQFGDLYSGTLGSYTAAILPGLLTGAGAENRICSPINVYMALSMLTELTDGESREQILTLLDCDSMETLRTRADALWNANYVDDGTVTSIPANSLWLNKNLDFIQETMDTLSETYHASSYRGEMGSKGFDRALQKWVDQNTQNRLRKQTSDLTMEPDTVLALVSTIYYRAKWSHEFSKGATSQGIFHAPDGDQADEFMHETTNGTYYWGGKFAAVSKSLKNSGDMWFLLPDEGVSMDELLTDSEVMEFLGTVTGFLPADKSWEASKYLKINLSLPKFDVVSDLNLVESLKALGITDVFNPDTADFSPMLEEASLSRLPTPPYVSKVRHAARVTIDEEGCEATAYIELPAAGAGAPPDDEVDFVLDRPFFFAITGTDGALLFAGIVNQP